MQADENFPPKISDSGALEPPVLGASAAAPTGTERRASPALRWLMAQFLSVCVALFAASAITAVIDDSIVLFLDQHWLANARANVLMLALLMSVGLYAVMALTPMISKRRFLPVALFIPAAMLGIIPFLIYAYEQVELISWIISLCQLVLAAAILTRGRGGVWFSWPLVRVDALRNRIFSWRNTVGFILVTLLLLAPLTLAYVAGCAALAISHYSDGFIALRRDGLIVEERKYVREDGKIVQLVPMSHIADSGFYRSLSESFPPTATVLAEGVTDQNGLLTNRITYKKIAKSLRVVEQHQAFKPRGRIVPADIDVKEFRTNTIDFVNLAMLVHSKGLNSRTISTLMNYSEPAGIEQELMYDMLTLRNWHLMQRIREELEDSDHLIVPWGAAHMPEIARELKKLNFRPIEKRRRVVIGF